MYASVPGCKAGDACVCGASKGVKGIGIERSAPGGHHVQPHADAACAQSDTSEEDAGSLTCDRARREPSVLAGGADREHFAWLGDPGRGGMDSALGQRGPRYRQPEKKIPIGCGRHEEIKSISGKLLARAVRDSSRLVSPSPQAAPHSLHVSACVKVALQRLRAEKNAIPLHPIQPNRCTVKIM